MRAVPLPLIPLYVLRQGTWYNLASAADKRSNVYHGGIGHRSDDAARYTRSEADSWLRLYPKMVIEFAGFALA